MGVGMPASLKLHEFGSHVWSVFGGPPYHVGSSVENKTGWRDVDVRMILDDEEWWKVWGFGDPDYVMHRDEKWIALCLAFSTLGREMTGLPIDFQIQPRTWANKKFKGRRDALGFVPWRLVDAKSENVSTEEEIKVRAFSRESFCLSLVIKGWVCGDNRCNYCAENAVKRLIEIGNRDLIRSKQAETTTMEFRGE